MLVLTSVNLNLSWVVEPRQPGSCLILECMWMLVHEGGQVALEGLRNILQSQSSSREPDLGEDDSSQDDGTRALPQKCRDLCEAALAPKILTYDSRCRQLLKQLPLSKLQLAVCRDVHNCAHALIRPVAADEGINSDLQIQADLTLQEYW